MNRTTKATFAALTLITLAGAAALIAAGPLNPPSGAVTSTGKTLSEVEPRIAINATNTPGGTVDVFRITQPGSYYLTGNIIVPNGKSGISVEASDITIDLNGFAILGETGAKNGIYQSVGTSYRVTIRNGSMRFFGLTGIDFIGPFSQPQQLLIENVSVSNCGGNGIRIGSGIVRNCHSAKNTLSGITVTDPKDSIVENCTAHDNGANGINVGTGTIRGCSASNNTVNGISMDTGVIAHCTASNNAVGFVSYSGQVIDSAAVDNTTTGILVTGDCLVRGNSVTASTVRANTIGIQVQGGTGARIENNQITRMVAGINSLTANNLFIGNSLRGCTNAFNVLAGNRVGTIVTGTASPAIIGNTGGGLGVTDPMANIIQ